MITDVQITDSRCGQEKNPSLARCEVFILEPSKRAVVAIMANEDKIRTEAPEDQQEPEKKVRKIIVPIGVEEQSIHASNMQGPWASEYARLEAFHDLMDEKGGPRFNTRIFLRRDESVCHFNITRCVFHDFFSSVGTPELTRLFCEVDRVFFTGEFP